MISLGIKAQVYHHTFKFIYIYINLITHVKKIMMINSHLCIDVCSGDEHENFFVRTFSENCSPNLVQPIDIYIYTGTMLPIEFIFSSKKGVHLGILSPSFTPACII